jgi:hypothetical protein
MKPSQETLVNTIERKGWSDILLDPAILDGSRAIELFYAHLTLGRLSNAGGDGIRLLTEVLPLSAKSRRHLLSQNPARLLIYRDLVRATFKNTLRLAMPRACSRLGASFEPIFDDFLAEHAAFGRCLRDVTPSFLHFIRQFPPQGVPPYLWELAELEALQIFVASAPTREFTAAQAQIEPQIERGLVFSESVVLLFFEHAVHLLSVDPGDKTAPEQRNTQLLAYRDGEHEVRTMELTRLAALILKRLIKGDPLGSSIQGACEEEKVELTPDVLSGSARVLSDLAQRGALLGVRGPASEQP